LPATEDLLRVRRHYAANMSMIDHKIGEIITALENKGDLDNTIVIFTSDHADALGDHGHIQKWTMFDTVLRVPLIVWAPGLKTSSQSIDDPVELVDIAATILEAAGLEVPADWDGVSLLPLVTGKTKTVGDDVVYAELARDHIQTEAEMIIMRRDRDWKVVWYLNQQDGELYDLNADPEEIQNLWFSPSHQKLRDRLVDQVRDRTISGMLASRRVPTPKPQGAMPIT
jgi:arylsulfatase